MAFSTRPPVCIEFVGVDVEVGTEPCRLLGRTSRRRLRGRSRATLRLADSARQAPSAKHLLGDVGDGLPAQPSWGVGSPLPALRS